MSTRILVTLAKPDSYADPKPHDRHTIFNKEKSEPYEDPRSKQEHGTVEEERSDSYDLDPNDWRIVIFEKETSDSYADSEDSIKSKRPCFEGRRLPFKE